MKHITLVLAALISLSAAAQKKNIKTETFIVNGTCQQCKDRIEKTLSLLGTYKTNWSIETHQLTVSFDSTRLNKTIIQKKMAAVGHDTEEFQAESRTYKNLPECCHYDRLTAPIVQDSFLLPEKIKISDILASVRVVSIDKDGHVFPLPNATITQLNNQQQSITDSAGQFRLALKDSQLVSVSYTGLITDTVKIFPGDALTIYLKNSSADLLGEVVLKSKNQNTYVSAASTFNTLNLGSKELSKAACCNLSESFETSPSVDVSYADAVTGIKQIQLLGLSGNYTQLLTENTPEIRGLAGSYGLTFIPGPWIDGIQVTKGTGTVVNGYESIAGQINIDEKKPGNIDRLFINAYANNMGRLETTVNLSQKINAQWNSALLAHANSTYTKADANNDGFLDNPLGRQFNIISRWQYADTKGLFAQFAIKALNDKRQAGEYYFNPNTDKFTTNKYGAGIEVQQYSISGKLGYLFPDKKYKSVGLILSATDYANEAYYGLNRYKGKQRSFYANLIYQSIIGNTNYKFRTGFSFTNDQFNESYNAATFKRTEVVPGAFFEFTYTATSKLTAIAGLRADYHNQYGWITTPRLHLKYDITPKTNLRFSIGSGARVANIFAENTSVFVSSRQYQILNPSSDYGYGLQPEKAWNYGFNFIRQFKLKNHTGTFSLDAYRTNFSNQVVVDVDASPQKILFYNLSGKSFSNSIQAELNYELVKKLEVRLAYRWLDVQTNYQGTLLEKQLIAKHRAFVNIAYETGNHWKFDITAQWLSKKRLPNTSSNPVVKKLDAYSPAFIQLSGQISKQLNSRWDIYAGGENLTNYTQKQRIISADQPFSPYFDGSIAWGPVNGTVIYAGFRFKVK